MATQNCPNCNKQFKVPDDEVNDHPCSFCGWYFDWDDEEDDK